MRKTKRIIFIVLVIIFLPFIVLTAYLSIDFFFFQDGFNALKHYDKMTYKDGKYTYQDNEYIWVKDFNWDTYLDRSELSLISYSYYFPYSSYYYVDDINNPIIIYSIPERVFVRSDVDYKEIQFDSYKDSTNAYNFLGKYSLNQLIGPKVSIESSNTPLKFNYSEDKCIDMYLLNNEYPFMYCHFVIYKKNDNYYLEFESSIYLVSDIFAELLDEIIL